ncbi:EamA family transporter RarD [Lentzea guizhouensis]|uniref:EamA family transporter RarD n=1 Tax=Lentzea guizhouensis TaxID=1586287 RepID=UPI0009F53878|nr:EamA family transporter RarD [Lentzea guizhouensis]
MPPLTSSSLTSAEVHTQGRGITYGAAAYVLWGLFPAYWPLLVPAAPVEVLAHRVVWSFVTMGVLLAVLRKWRPLVELSGRGWLIVSAAAVLITANWGTYIYAVNTGHVVESALGYFITPLVSVVLGMVFLKERLRLPQFVAIGVVVIAVIVLTVDYGKLPTISLVLACSFGVYGLLKKKVPLDATSSLAAESAVIAPIALVYLLMLGSANTFTTEGTGHTLMLLSTGIVTVIPLLLFGLGARLIPLSTMGMLQYLAPVLQFAWGVFVVHEPMPASRWTGFVLVWVALVIFTVDAVRNRRKQPLAPVS